MYLCVLLATFSLGSALSQNIASLQAASWPDPEPCTGNCSFIHDPAMIKRSDGTWFRMSTNGNIAIASAPDPTGPWTYQGAMIPEGSSITIIDGQEMWAPDVFFDGTTYYAYYAVSKIGLKNSSIGVATSTSLDQGSWADHGDIGLPLGDPYNKIDANLFRETGDSPVIFNFGSGWDAVFTTSMNSDFVTWQEGSQISQVAFNSTFPDGGTFPSITEGAFEFWWGEGENKWYYLFFSSGACCNSAFDPSQPLAAPGDEYKIMVCRSKSAMGPFVDKNGVDCRSQNGGTLLLGSHGNVYAPGGQGVLFEASMGRPIIYYHYVDPRLGYRYEDFTFGFNYLDFSSTWPEISK